MQFLLWSINELWLKDEFDLYYLLQLHLLFPEDGQQANADGWAFATRSPPSHCLEQMSGDKNDDVASAPSSCSSTSLPCSSPLPITQRRETNGLKPRAIGSTWFITLCFTTQSFGSREEQMWSGDGQPAQAADLSFCVPALQFQLHMQALVPPQYKATDFRKLHQG